MGCLNRDVGWSLLGWVMSGVVWTACLARIVGIALAAGAELDLVVWWVFAVDGIFSASETRLVVSAVGFVMSILGAVLTRSVEYCLVGWLDFVITSGYVDST